MTVLSHQIQFYHHIMLGKQLKYKKLKQGYLEDPELLKATSDVSGS